MYWYLNEVLFVGRSSGRALKRHTHSRWRRHRTEQQTQTGLALALTQKKDCRRVDSDSCMKFEWYVTD